MPSLPAGALEESQPDRRAILAALERKVLWLAAWTIHNANHLRPSRDGLKVGGHQASCASLTAIMTALYFDVLRPEDRIAVKPHAAPVFHAIQYLLGRESRARLERFRSLGGAQSYPSRTKDDDDVDFSTGSVGLGAAQTVFAALAQDYLACRGLLGGARGRMIALVGDAELDEGNVFEALLESWKHDVRNLWWVVDYNRQSLDSVVSDRLFGRIDELFRSVGWRVLTLKYGRLLEAAFAEPGGTALKDWIDACPNSLYSALTFKGGAGWRERLDRDLAGDAAAIPELVVSQPGRSWASSPRFGQPRFAAPKQGTFSVRPDVTSPAHGCLRLAAERRLGTSANEIGMRSLLRENGSAVVQRNHNRPTAARTRGATAGEGAGQVGWRSRRKRFRAVLGKLCANDSSVRQFRPKQPDGGWVRRRVMPTAYGEDDKVGRNRAEQGVAKMQRTHPAREPPMVRIDEDRRAKILGLFQQICQADTIEVAGQQSEPGAADGNANDCADRVGAYLGRRSVCAADSLRGQVWAGRENVDLDVSRERFSHSGYQPNLELEETGPMGCIQFVDQVFPDVGVLGTVAVQDYPSDSDLT